MGKKNPQWLPIAFRVKTKFLGAHSGPSVYPSPCSHVLGMPDNLLFLFSALGIFSYLYFARNLSFKPHLAWDPIKDALPDLSVIGTILPSFSG